MKVKDVLGSYHALNVLCSSQLKASSSFKIGKIRTLLKNEFNEFEDMKEGKAKDYGLDGKVDNNGVLIFPKDITKEDREELENNLRSLLDELNSVTDEESKFEVPEKTICIGDLVKSNGTEIDIAPAILSQLDWVIED